MRRLLSALVGMAGLAAAGLILLMAFNDSVLDAVVTFAVSGEIPGTNAQLDFTSSVVSGASIVTIGILSVALYRISLNREITNYITQNAANGTPEEPTEPFDGEDIIMVADDIFDELISGHQGLPVQLQLF